ncbi:hypothetical protein [Streptomyces massasporeus]|uniref:hypothetical protein n=1 Tax=Streptomyces massasporeus TaxID=67324 RepID=UPI00380C85AB
MLRASLDPVVGSVRCRPTVRQGSGTGCGRWSCGPTPPYRVDLAALRPRLWLALPDPARAELTDAYAAYRANARLTGWGLTYLLVALW